MLDKKRYPHNIFLISPGKYILATHWKCLCEAILMSTHNIRFYGGIIKVSVLLVEESAFSRAVMFTRLSHAKGILNP